MPICWRLCGRPSESRVCRDCRCWAIQVRVIVVAGEKQHHGGGQDADDQQASEQNFPDSHGMMHRDAGAGACGPGWGCCRCSYPTPRSLA
jgi:hypothetical protein